MPPEIRQVTGLSGACVENGPIDAIKADDRIISGYLETLTPGELDLWCQEIAPHATGKPPTVQLDELRKAFGVSRRTEMGLAKKARPFKIFRRRRPDIGKVPFCGTPPDIQQAEMFEMLDRVNLDSRWIRTPYFVSALMDLAKKARPFKIFRRRRPDIGRIPFCAIPDFEQAEMFATLKRVNHNRRLLRMPYFVSAFEEVEAANHKIVVDQTHLQVRVIPSGRCYVTFPSLPTDWFCRVSPPDPNKDYYVVEDLGFPVHRLKAGVNLNLIGILCVAFSHDRVAVFDGVDEAVEVAKKFASLSSEPTADE